MSKAFREKRLFPEYSTVWYLSSLTGNISFCRSSAFKVTVNLRLLSMNCNAHFFLLGYYKLLEDTTGYCKLLVVTTVYCMLQQGLLDVITVY